MTFLAGLVVGLAAAAWSAPGLAEDARRVPSGSGAVRSSAAQSGRKLQWLPYRPSGSAAGRRPEATEEGPRTASRAPIRTAQRPGGKAFEDPFADGRGPSVRTLAAIPGDNLPEDGLPEEPALQPTPDVSHPSGELPGGQLDTDIERLPLPATDRAYQQEPVEPIEACPSPSDPAYHTKIGELSSDIAAEEGEFPRECTLTEETLQPFALGQVRVNALGEPWIPTTFTWKASALCHKPLYFEEVHLERYGQPWGPLLQPVMSGAHFFLSVPVLPYRMGLYPPSECIYTLGYYRPGSCAPYMLDPLPLSIRAGLAEASAWTGMPFLIP